GGLVHRVEAEDDHRVGVLRRRISARVDTKQQNIEPLPLRPHRRGVVLARVRADARRIRDRREDLRKEPGPWRGPAIRGRVEPDTAGAESARTRGRAADDAPRFDTEPLAYETRTPLDGAPASG